MLVGESVFWSLVVGFYLGIFFFPSSCCVPLTLTASSGGGIAKKQSDFGNGHVMASSRLGFFFSALLVTDGLNLGYSSSVCLARWAAMCMHGEDRNTRHSSGFRYVFSLKTLALNMHVCTYVCTFLCLFIFICCTSHRNRDVEAVDGVGWFR